MACNTWELRLRRPFDRSHEFEKFYTPVISEESWAQRDEVHCPVSHSSVVADPRLELRLMLVLCQLSPPHCSQCGSLNYIIPPILFHWLAGLSMNANSSEVICKGNTSIIHWGNVLLNSFRILNFGQAIEWAHQVEHEHDLFCSVIWPFCSWLHGEIVFFFSSSFNGDIINKNCMYFRCATWCFDIYPL